MSSKGFHLAIITPEGKLFDAEATEVNLPGSEGRFGVLVGHMHLIAALKPGVLEFHAHGSKESQLIVVYDGLAEITGESCSVLVEKGIFPKDLPTAELNVMLANARKELADAASEVAKESAIKDIEYLEAIAQLKAN